MAATPAVEERSTERAQADGLGADGGERLELLVADAALGADDDDDLAAARDREVGERARRRLVEYDGHGSVAQQVDDVVGGDDVAYLGEPRPPRLLGGLAGGGPPPGERLVLAVAAPHGDDRERGPGHDHVDADLGEHLDGELAAVALRDGLDDDDSRRLGVARRRPRRRATCQPALWPLR